MATKYLTNNSSIPIEATFSAYITGFNQSDIELFNSTISGFNGEGAVYSFNVNPSQDGVSWVFIPSGVNSDGSSLASDTLFFNYDGTRPQIEISSDLYPFTKQSNIPYEINFSEVVTGFDLNDINIINGQISNFISNSLSVNNYLIFDASSSFPEGDGLSYVIIDDFQGASGSFSIGGWGENNGSDYTTIMSKRSWDGGGGYFGWHLSYENDGSMGLYCQENTSGNENRVTTDQIFNELFHIVAVFDAGNSMSLYVNGDLVSTSPTSLTSFCMN